MKKTMHYGANVKFCWNITDNCWKLSYKVRNKWTCPSVFTPFRKGKQMPKGYAESFLPQLAQVGHLIDDYIEGKIAIYQFVDRAELVGIGSVRLTNIITKLNIPRIAIPIFF